MSTEYIDLTPTWGEVGNMIWRLAVSNEQAALVKLKPEFAKACAAAQALKNIQPTLTEDQSKVVAETFAAELTKQGY